MESLDTTILNTAVPVISQALDVAPLSMKSVLASYTLSLAVFIPISGWMADRFGTRRVFASAIGLFTLGSVLCGISSDIHLLVACRVLQGCGGAMMVPVGRLTLVRTFDKSELIRAMSFVAIPGLIGPMLGPIAGGLIVGYLQWRFIFFVNLPVGIAGLFLVYLHLPDYREENTKPLDIVGLILFGSGVALLSYVLEIFGEHALSLGEILGLLSISLALIVGYGMHATKTASPLLDLNLFRIRTFSAAVSGSFFTRLVSAYHDLTPWASTRSVGSLAKFEMRCLILDLTSSTSRGGASAVPHRPFGEPVRSAVPRRRCRKRMNMSRARVAGPLSYGKSVAVGRRCLLLALSMALNAHLALRWRRTIKLITRSARAGSSDIIWS